MPELPEVEHLRLTLVPRLLGRSFSAARVHRRDVIIGPQDPPGGFSRSRRRRRPRGLSPGSLLVGATIRDLHRTGKQLAIVAEDGRAVCIHLGMSGQLRWRESESPYRRAEHEHLTWRLDDGSRLIFRDPRRFGGVWLFDSLADLQARRWSGLGPDAMTITADQLLAALAGSHRPLKAALLDQSVIAGVGNIYADEALFAARLSPLRSAADVRPAEASVLVRAIQTIMQASIASGGSTLRDYVDGNGRLGTNQSRFAVYGRAGDRCFACGRALRALQVAQRTTVMCSGCQD